MHTIFGMPIHISPFDLVRNVPVRKHRFRRNQSPAYHARIQKKWIKRYGTKPERYAVIANMGAIGIGGGQRIFMDTQSISVLRGL